MRRSPKRVIKFYNGRGTAEQWIKEGKNALNWTRLSCRRFKDNQMRLQLFALAYNLGNFLWQMALPRIGAKVVARSKAVTFQMAEVAMPRTLFAAILDRIGRLRLVPGPG
jgi:Transposase DDE domain group 1